jgi:alcohol dehydrogenase class IV
MRQFQPDTIIALGGGSPMDASKVMWLLYEHPEVEFSDMREKFFDVRKRAFKFPELGKLAKLVCIPTTSGTGSEMTPFAVITDDESGMKYPLADYALTPSVAIIDPVLTKMLPGFLVADAGFDALTHATEAFVSVYANDYTDGLCLHAIKLIFENIERSTKAQPNSTDAEDIKAREKMHNAASISGMAFGNAFLGIVHAMAHVTGATYHLVHGRTNAVYLPHVIRYNGKVPTKLTSWPKYERYIAPERFQEIAKHLVRRRPRKRAWRATLGPSRSSATGRHRAVVPAAGRRRDDLHLGSARPRDGRLRRPVRAGEPAHADDRRHGDAHGGGVLRHVVRRGAFGPQGRRGRERCGHRHGQDDGEGCAPHEDDGLIRTAFTGRHAVTAQPHEGAGGASPAPFLHDFTVTHM